MIRYNIPNIKLKQIVLTVYIVLMSVQIIVLEGYSVSPVKVVAMSLAPLLMLVMRLNVKDLKAIIYGLLCLMLMMACSVIGGGSVSWDRIGYRAMYIMMFVCVYGIIYEGGINIQYIIKVLKVLLLAYGILCLLQQLMYLLGMSDVSFLNYYPQTTMMGVFKVNGLSVEASHTGRIMPILYWGVLKLTEIERGTPIKFRESWRKFPLITTLFWLTIATIGSATAIIGGILIILNFFGRNYFLIFCGVVLLAIFMGLDIDNSQIQRVQLVFNTLFAEDSRAELIKHESSGAVRILPILNTFSIDLFELSSWVGQGNVSSVTEHNFTERMFDESRYIGDVTSYGLLTYFATLIFVYGCCIKRFFSMESLMFLALATFSVGSVYYTWLMLIIFCVVKYYNEVYSNSIKSTELSS